jgi:two-component system sensor histidine kinase YesM
MEMIRSNKKTKIFPIRWKLIISFLIFMVFIVFIGVYINLGLKMSARLFKGLLAEYKSLESVSSKIYRVKYHTDNFLSDSSYSSLEQCLLANAQLGDEVDRITNYLSSIDNQEKYYRYLDLSKNIANIMRLSELTIGAKRDNHMDSAYENNARLTEAANLCVKYIGSLMNQNTTWGSERYQRVSLLVRRIEYLAYILAIVIGLLSITFCISFSMDINRPLEQIVINAEAIASGNFKVAEVTSESNDELQIISKVFNRMSKNIHELFTEIQEKAKLEAQLKEAKVQNLEVTNLLRESEIQNLQAQINPHFLYNTLNAISQVAILEDAVETGDLIKAVANLLRYNLRSLDRPVTLFDEVENIKQYTYIMGVRYGEQISCRLFISGDLGRFLVPCMILQPLIENAYLHGVAGLVKSKGLIKVEITATGSQAQIVISDNGVGIKPEILQQILAPLKTKKPFSKDETGSNSTGLGLVNIQKRLALFYKQDNLLTIDSQQGEGTTVALKLPLVEEVSSRCTV